MPAPESPASFPDDELLALLKDATVSPESISAEMADAGAAPLPPAALAAARAVLGELGPGQAPAVEALLPPLRTLVLNVAVTQQAVELLTLLAASADKGVVKDAKRCLHVLKSRGLKVEAPRAAPVPAAAPEEQHPVYMSSIDGLGRRVVLFTGAARGGVDVAQLVLSDETGVVSAEFHPLGRKSYREFLDRIQSLRHMFVVEAPRPYARSLVAAALDLNARARRPVPPTFNDVAFLMGPAVGSIPSPGRNLPRPEVEAALAAEARRLFEVPELSTWIPPDREAEAFDRKVRDVLASSLYIDEQQRSAAIRELVASSVETFWSREQRDRYAGRLFDMAFLFQQAKRDEHSALALASAWALAGEAPISAVPFAWVMFEILVPSQAPGEQAPPRETAAPQPGNLILP